MPLSNLTLEPRGVYIARYTVNGSPLAYAVDSHGDRVRELAVRGTVTVQAARRLLRAYLDEVDAVAPVPTRPALRLVAPQPANALPLTPTTLLALCGAIRRQAPASKVS